MEKEETKETTVSDSYVVDAVTKDDYINRRAHELLARGFFANNMYREALTIYEDCGLKFDKGPFLKAADELLEADDVEYASFLFDRFNGKPSIASADVLLKQCLNVEKISKYLDFCKRYDLPIDQNSLIVAGEKLLERGFCNKALLFYIGAGFKTGAIVIGNKVIAENPEDQNKAMHYYKAAADMEFEETKTSKKNPEEKKSK